MSDRKPSFYGRRKTGAFAKAAQRGSVFQQPVLKEGYLEKQSSGMVKKWQSRYFELSGHYIKYYEKKESKSDETLKGAVDLQEISEVTSQAAQIIIVMNDGKKILLKGLSDQVAGLWVTEIQEVVKGLQDAGGGSNPQRKAVLQPALSEKLNLSRGKLSGRNLCDDIPTYLKFLDTPETAIALHKLLLAHEIDSPKYGKNGAKTVENLFGANVACFVSVRGGSRCVFFLSRCR
jgi:hypothetical protein